jgi:septum formation protein
MLGSGSPRRKLLLQEMGFRFRIKTLPTDESYPDHLEPVGVATYLAQKKSLPLRSELLENEVLITSDTVVALDHEIFGKSEYHEEAFEMLRKLSGKTHQVISGLCVYHNGKELLDYSITHVTFKVFTDAELNYYIERYQPFDKAGSYGIQEWIGQIGVEKIEGSYYNVVGLPTEKLWDILWKLT